MAVPGAPGNGGGCGVWYWWCGLEGPVLKGVDAGLYCTHRLVLLCIDAHCFIFWDLPGDVIYLSMYLSWQHLNQLYSWIGVMLLSLSLLKGFDRGRAVEKGVWCRGGAREGFTLEWRRKGLMPSRTQLV